MTIFPAIDIRGGRCVRLLRGERGTETVYQSDPVEAALVWETKGAEALHVVDLDAAFGREGDNRALIRKILQATRVPVQVGGGVRTVEDFAQLVDAGAGWVVFGTVAVEKPELVRGALARERSKVAIGVDVRHGRVAVRGWEQESSLEAVPFARKWIEDGVSTFIYTDILRDGSLQGPNVEAVRSFARATGGVRVVASGGIGTLADLRRLRELETEGVEAAIVGKALYEKAFTLEEAQRVGAWG